MASPRPAFVCRACAHSLRVATRVPLARRVSTTTTSTTKRSKGQSAQVAPFEDVSAIPRWKKTPPRMKMPVRVRPMPDQVAWTVNEDQEVLDQILDSFLGSLGEQQSKGRDMLPEEVKWLAVTHKTFEHGARGFNDRLALLGKRILDVQVSKALLAAPPGPYVADPMEQVQDEEIIGPVQRHPDLKSVDNISDFKKQRILDPKRVARLAEHYGMDKTTRWMPRKTADPERSGRDIVLTSTLYALVGAVAMQKGGEVANTVVKEKILRPLGL